MLQKFCLRTGPADHALLQAQLDQVLERQPEKLLIQLVGPGGTPPDAVLAYIDLLKQTSCAVAITAYGNLLGADFALWLGASQLREIRPTAFVFVPEQYQAPAAGAEPTQVQTLETMVDESAYSTCLGLMAEYVELEGFLNRRVEPAELQALFLLDCGPLDNLPALEAGPPPPSPPSRFEGPTMEGGAR